MFNQDIHLQTVAFVMLIFGGDFGTSTASCFAHALNTKRVDPKVRKLDVGADGEGFCGFLWLPQYP